MAQQFDKVYLSGEKYKRTAQLDNDTDFVIQPLKHSHQLADLFKTLLHRMRNVAKTNYTIKETLEHRRPRIQFCGYSVAGNDNSPILLCKNDKGGLFFNGLANCASFWRCPVCAVKISENKKELLTTLITAHQNKGFCIGFVTLTVRHKRTDTLKFTLDKLLNNYRTFQMGRGFQKEKEAIGMIGQVKTLEITWSKENGWHPHLHLLYFYDNSKGSSATEFQKRLISKWFKFKNNNGTLNAQNQKILTTDISDYVAKYDITCEMTKGNLKGSKGLTPFTALGKIVMNDFADIFEKRLLYGLYSVFVEETFGRHYVNISNSLTKMYESEIAEFNKTDEEIVNEVKIEEVLLKISVRIWQKIAKNDLQPLVLNKFKENGLDGVYKLLTYFRDFKDLEVEIDKNEIPILV